MQLIATDNKQVIVGLGVTGLSCARYLAGKKQTFSVVDSRDVPPCLSEFKQEFPNVRISLGEISDESLAGATQLIVSPGISLQEPVIARAIDNGTAVCGDIDLFIRQAQAPIIAITGSNGKSTVTTLVAEMLKAGDKRIAVGGNIGVPALAILANDIDFYVLELSSFQLERTQPLNVEVATVLNVSADHMDRYESVVAYHQAKHRIFFGCHQVVVNRADTLSKPLVADDIPQWTFALNKPDFKGFGLIKDKNEAGESVDYLAFQFETLMPVSELKMAGKHNIENALAAMALVHAVGLPFAPMLQVLREFTGLPHRCQFVAEKSGVRFYNDSKGTNVGASVSAIQGLSDSANKVVLIAGGEAKGADFKPLISVLAQHGRAAVLIGNAAEQLTRLLDNVVPLDRADSMADAVTKASALAEEGDAVLLSPACASFDMFDNFEQRGDMFMQHVNHLVEVSQR